MELVKQMSYLLAGPDPQTSKVDGGKEQQRQHPGGHAGTEKVVNIVAKTKKWESHFL